MCVRSIIPLEGIQIKQYYRVHTWTYLKSETSLPLKFLIKLSRYNLTYPRSGDKIRVFWKTRGSLEARRGSLWSFDQSANAPSRLEHRKDPRTSLRKDLERSQKAIPGNLSDNSISSRARRRNLFTGLIMVFCRVHRQFSCFCGTVNGLTTNRQDLHRITNAFTTNLFVCDQSARWWSIFLSLLPVVSLSLFLRWYLCLFIFLRSQLRASPGLRRRLCSWSQRQFPPRLVV